MLRPQPESKLNLSLSHDTINKRWQNLPTVLDFTVSWSSRGQNSFILTGARKQLGVLESDMKPTPHSWRLVESHCSASCPQESRGLAGDIRPQEFASRVFSAPFELSSGGLDHLRNNRWGRRAMLFGESLQGRSLFRLGILQ
jgi:hypothetical protein